MDSRPAVFASSPQSVEVYQAGTWWRGELLGWRHDAAGMCQMRVRVVVGGVEETAWIDLAGLRLPERPLSPVTEPSRIDPRVKQELPPAQAISALRGRAVTADATTTAALPMIRDESPSPSVRGAGAAAPTVSVPRSGGRRRAPEDADIQVVVAAEVAVPPGRHRAPRDEGRHRAADTEVFPVLTDESDELPALSPGTAPAAEPRRPARGHTAGWSVPQARTARSEESFVRSEVCTGRIDAEPDLLTRPMRLGDLTASSRRPWVGGSVSGV
jgi:hypothetical protein